ncbi:MAG TPA: sigma-70 family RNA polymerase sigma factor [Candidatus Angelobacter sp.]|nr:sigma-70 family RNA polymerase sigma factor [Candidatus Angelobacter sp.]
MAAAAQLQLLNFDAGYLNALRRGEPDTERHFFEYFSPLIRRKLRKYLHSAELIEEAKQETFVRVLAAVRSRSGVRHPERFGAFVHAVCRNVALEIWRQERRFVALDEVDEDSPGPFRSPHSLAEAGEARERVKMVLAELSSFDRQLLEAAFMHEEERHLLCRRLGVSRPHLRVLLHRARQRFANHDLIKPVQPKADAAQEIADQGAKPKGKKPQVRIGARILSICPCKD